MEKIRLSYNKVSTLSYSILLAISTLSFSWTPLVFILPLMLILLFIRAFFSKLKLELFILIAISFFILKYVDNQIIYIEKIRNVMIAFLIPICYFFTIDKKYIDYYSFLNLIYKCSIIVVVYIFLVEIPQDIGLFLSDRRGFYAKEFLFFGRKYPFSLGVTHISLYINFINTFLLIKLINENKTKKKYLTILFFLILVISTRSRSPILYFIIIFYIYRKYLAISKNSNTLKKIRKYLVVIFSLFMLSILLDEIIIFFNSQSRLNDMSRLIFFAKGFEHMFKESLGNSLLYTDPTMPLLNYHNTYLALGNRIGLWFFLLMIIITFLNFYMILKIKNTKKRYTFFLVLYFCFHNFMVEDVVKFDFFVLVIFFSIFPMLKTIKKNE